LLTRTDAERERTIDMKRDILRHPALLVACALALVASSSVGRSDVAQTGDPAPRQTPEAHAVTPPAGVALRTQCWQHGVKIIEQDGLLDMALATETKQQSVTFKRRAESQSTVFILPFPDGLCLVQPQP
jgi:hypothetical protein